KSGANTRHGDGFLFAQSGALNARPKLEETAGGGKPSLRRFRGGGAIGGSIVANRTFYYAAGEREASSAETASRIDPLAAEIINEAVAARSSSVPRAPALTTGAFPTDRTETEGSAKFTQQFERQGSVAGGMAASHSRDSDSVNAGALSDVSARGRAFTRDVALTTSWAKPIGSRMANDLRGQVGFRRLDLHSPAHGPAVLIPGVAEFGSAYAGNNTHDHRYLEVGDTIASSHGAHFMKAGVDVQHVAVTGVTDRGRNGLYVFPSVSAFAKGEPESFRQTSGGTATDVRLIRVSGFVQDRWTPRSAFTIDVGVRFEASMLPASLAIASRAISPRIGVAWSPASLWLVRGGAGTFADRLALAAFEPALMTERQHAVEQIVTGPMATDLYARGATSSSLLSVPGSIYTAAPGRWSPQSQQASVGVERQLTANLTVSANYLLVRGRNLARTVNVNLLPPTILTRENAASLGVETPVPQQVGRLVFGAERRDPSRDAIFDVQPTASSRYHGATLTLNRRLAQEIEWSASYTWSHASDDASDFDEQPQDPYALGDEWSDSRYDQRHRFVASALFDLPIGEEEAGRPRDTEPNGWVRIFRHIAVAPIVTIGSGHSVNVTVGADANRTRAIPPTARPLDVERNSWRLPASATLDLRILKYFPIKPHGKLDLVIEAFNLLNRTNVTQANTVFGPLSTPLGSFGHPLGAGPARQLQFSIDFEF
ncbi:MAG: TonB-dependent receptor, partial [Burkholderiaceae bacterium]